MEIDASFDGGNIEVVRKDGMTADLAIRWDVGEVHRQWFAFRAVGARGQTQRFCIVNASECSYPKAWDGYQVAASYDGRDWFRVKTKYDGVLSFEHTPDSDVVYYAYFAIFDGGMHRDLIATASRSELADVRVLGQTLDGQPMDLVRVGSGALNIWVIARQHPGESMAEHWMVGFLGRLLDTSCPQARRLRAHATLHVVPNMNPDGSRRGHLRTNAAGCNLNRAWMEPSMDESPEVFLVREEMERTGVSAFLDVHGDEELPYVFVAGGEGIPSFSPRMEKLEADFSANYERSNPDFQQVHGYPKDAPGQANLTIASNWVAEQFDCLSVTLEMPFKDNANDPDPLRGWSPARCEHLGASAVDALLHTLVG